MEKLRAWQDMVVIQTYDSNDRFNTLQNVLASANTDARSPMPDLDTAVPTRERLLDAAESLMAASGIAATSLRAITARGDANLAAVNYHFGSKDELVRAVLTRRLEPLNRSRLEELAAAEASAGGASVEDILVALLGPVLRWSADARHHDFIRLMGRLFNEPSDLVGPILASQFGEVIEAFHAAFAAALPHLDKRELHWRFHFVIGTMVHVVANPEHVLRLSGGRCDPGDAEATLAELVAFTAAGLRADHSCESSKRTRRARTPGPRRGKGKR